MTPRTAAEVATGTSEMSRYGDRTYAVDPEGAILSQHGRREAARLAGAAAAQEWAEEEALRQGELPKETLEALQAAHDTQIGIALATAASAERTRNAGITAAQEAAAREAEPAKPLAFFVRRGGEWGRIERSKLKPGEHVFTKRPNGQMQTVGVVDAIGQAPPEEMIL